MLRSTSTSVSPDKPLETSRSTERRSSAVAGLDNSWQRAVLRRVIKLMDMVSAGAFGSAEVQTEGLGQTVCSQSDLVGQ